MNQIFLAALFILHDINIDRISFRPVGFSGLWQNALFLQFSRNSGQSWPGFISFTPVQSREKLALSNSFRFRECNNLIPGRGYAATEISTYQGLSNLILNCVSGLTCNKSFFTAQIQCKSEYT